MENKKYTVCLYDGSVVHIDNVVATQVVEADGIDNFDHIAIFYDLIHSDGPSQAKVYRNRISKKDFTVYYERIICLSDTLHTYDFGSYSRFIAVCEGEISEEKLKNILQENREI